jgi:hypothetical protein
MAAILINRPDTALLGMFWCLYVALKDNIATFAWTGHGLLEVVQKMTVCYFTSNKAVPRSLPPP